VTGLIAGVTSTARVSNLKAQHGSSSVTHMILLCLVPGIADAPEFVVSTLSRVLVQYHTHSRGQDPQGRGLAMVRLTRQPMQVAVKI
jgi:hypothetical protein